MSEPNAPTELEALAMKLDHLAEKVNALGAPPPDPHGPINDALRAHRGTQGHVNQLIPDIVPPAPFQRPTLEPGEINPNAAHGGPRGEALSPPISGDEWLRDAFDQWRYGAHPKGHR